MCILASRIRSTNEDSDSILPAVHKVQSHKPPAGSSRLFYTYSTLRKSGPFCRITVFLSNYWNFLQYESFVPLYCAIAQLMPQSMLCIFWRFNSLTGMFNWVCRSDHNKATLAISETGFLSATNIKMVRQWSFHQPKNRTVPLLFGACHPSLSFWCHCEVIIQNQLVDIHCYEHSRLCSRCHRDVHVAFYDAFHIRKEDESINFVYFSWNQRSQMEK